jgi:hypothetical protein
MQRICLAILISATQGVDVRFGLLTDFPTSQRDVRFVPIADIQRDDAPFSIADFAVLGRSYSVSADVRLVFLNDI